MKNIKSVKSLGVVKLYCIYRTKNYSLFSPHKDNRGRDYEKEGINNKRVKQFIKFIKKGKYKPVMGVIFIDNNGNIVEGVNRFYALKHLKMEIVFLVVDPMNINEIAEFNSSLSQKWSPLEHFNSAKIGGVKVAVLLDKYRTEITTRFDLDESKLSPGEMYGILVGDTKHFGNGKHAPTRMMYDNSELLKVTKSSDFKKDLELYGRMKKEFKNNRDAYKYCKAIMEFYFVGSREKLAKKYDIKSFDIQHFVDNLRLHSFFVETSRLEDIREAVIEMYNINITKTERILVI